MKTPKISVIMSAYNSEKFISKSIDSILAQTFKNFELIIINDSSIDKTKDIIETYRKKDKRIKIICNRQNLGPAKSRNRALKIAKGEYIAIMDSDDVSLPKRLEVQYHFLENNPDIFLIGGGAININESGEETTKHNPIVNENKLRAALEKENAIYHPTAMFRKEKGNFYRDKFRYGQDYDFYLNLLTKEKRLINIQNILINYRINPNSISFSNRGKQKLFTNKAREFYWQRKTFGRDKYNNFNPNKILNLNTKLSKSKLVLKGEVTSASLLNEFEKLRFFSKRYFHFHGHVNNVMVYYLIRFFGGKINQCFNKILSRIYSNKIQKY